jgi:chromosome segregation ATPase
LARAEERAEALRAKLFDLQMQEIELQSRLDHLDYQLTPESIQRALALVGSVRPMDELRDGLRKKLESERARVNKVLEHLASSREQLEAALSRAEAELERLRQRLGSS